MLRLLSYLAPSIPAGFFHTAALAIRRGTGIDVDLQFEESISGPLPGDDNPFLDGRADIGFVCSPTYQWMHEDVELLPVPVPTDRRAGEQPVYFGELVVRADSAVTRLADLRGSRWAYNDRNSRSGWFSMVEEIAPIPPTDFFSALVHAGSHLESLRLIREGAVDAAAVDSNVLGNEARMNESVAESIRVIDSWGPFAIQPVVIRKEIPSDVRAAVGEALLRADRDFGAELQSFGFVRFTRVEPGNYGV